jgi:hypothetical protein
VTAFFTDDATARTRADQDYRAHVVMQYLDGRLRQGWHPVQAMEHAIPIGNPIATATPGPRRSRGVGSGERRRGLGYAAAPFRSLSCRAPQTRLSCAALAPRAARLPHAPHGHEVPVKTILRIFSTVHALMALLFALAALPLIAIAVTTASTALGVGWSPRAAQQIIEAIGLLAAAVVSLQMAQTILEEEVIRDAHISAPTRVRRFLSRFLVVVVVALAVEGLVATFKALHEDPSQLPYAASLLLAVAALLAGWGLFVRLNRYAEELEPEAMAAAKREDRKLR